MKPFWKNSRKKKTKNPSTPPQQKPRTRAKPKSMEEPWKPPMAVPPKAMGQERTPITQMLESARPVRKMCYIQISLLGVAGYIKVGNALTEPMTPGDSMENYWFTPMYFSDVWHTRRTIRTFMDLFKEDAT